MSNYHDYFGPIIKEDNFYHKLVAYPHWRQFHKEMKELFGEFYVSAFCGWVYKNKLENLEISEVLARFGNLECCYKLYALLESKEVGRFIWENELLDHPFDEILTLWKLSLE